jgi:fibro-slime domain-containing protein
MAEEALMNLNSKISSRCGQAGAAASLVLAAILFSGAAAPPPDPYVNLPATLQLTGVCRDFRWANETGGHADFEYVPTQGYAHYAGEVADTLDSDGKPIFASTGKKVTTQATDTQGRNIMPVSKSYIAARPGDHAGSVSTSAGGSTHTADAFNQWFRDVPGHNISMMVPLTLVRQPGTNTYSFNDRTDAHYMNLGGFFPINGQLYGNSPGQNKNFGFTYELGTTFVCQKNTGQVFTFTGDDDVFVFIDGKLVVDIGGVHQAVNQTIELDRLTWLNDGQSYSLKLFFAERHTTQSNVRIDTNLQLRVIAPPQVTHQYD